MDDLISRWNLLIALSNLAPHGEHAPEAKAFGGGLHAAVLCVKNVPAVAAEPVRRGRWTYKYSPSNDPRVNLVRIICSSCGLITGQKSAYCPSCGARMDLDPATEKEDSK